MDKLNKLTDKVFGPSVGPSCESFLHNLGVSPGVAKTIASLIIPGFVIVTLLLILSSRRGST